MLDLISNIVGAGLLANAVHQAMMMLNVPTPSRASPLPQGIWVGMKTADSPPDQCGSGLARECGASGNDDAECANAFAGKPTPTGISFALEMVDSPPDQCGSGLARESGVSGNDDAECANAFAGKPTPGGVSFALKTGLDPAFTGSSLPQEIGVGLGAYWCQRLYFSASTKAANAAEPWRLFG